MSIRPDLELVAGLVGRDVRVLDLGCGDGALLERLITRQGCAGHGVERSAEGFHACVARGVPVSQGDLEAELPELGDGAFDVAVLSRTLQAVMRPAEVLAQIGRVARRSVISLPNLGWWPLRAQLALRGRMPVSGSGPEPWFGTPNIHPCTLADFESLAGDSGLTILRRIALDDHGQRASRAARRAPNLLAAGAVYVLGAEGDPLTGAAPGG